MACTAFERLWTFDLFAILQADSGPACSFMVSGAEGGRHTEGQPGEACLVSRVSPVAHWLAARMQVSPSGGLSQPLAMDRSATL